VSFPHCNGHRLTLLFNGSLARVMLEALNLTVETAGDRKLCTDVLDSAQHEAKRYVVDVLQMAPDDAVLCEAGQPPQWSKRTAPDNPRRRAAKQLLGAVRDLYTQGFVLPGDKRPVRAILTEWGETGTFIKCRSVTAWVSVWLLSRSNALDDLHVQVSEHLFFNWNVDQIDRAKRQVATIAGLRRMYEIVISAGLAMRHETIVERRIKEQIANGAEVNLTAEAVEIVRRKSAGMIELAQSLQAAGISFSTPLEGLEEAGLSEVFEVSGSSDTGPRY
jgi:hypothetical protein